MIRVQRDHLVGGGAEGVEGETTGITGRTARPMLFSLGAAPSCQQLAVGAAAVVEEGGSAAEVVVAVAEGEEVGVVAEEAGDADEDSASYKNGGLCLCATGITCTATSVTNRMNVVPWERGSRVVCQRTSYRMAVQQYIRI